MQENDFKMKTKNCQKLKLEFKISKITQKNLTI